MSSPRVLVLSGVDSSGGAGLDVDCEVIRAAGLEPIGVATAHTLQTGAEVSRIDPASPADMFRAVEQAFSECPPEAVKIGMIPSLDVLAVIVRILESFDGAKVVFDPVVKSSSGFSLMEPPVLSALTDQLHGKIDVLTPNSLEAAVLGDGAVASLTDAEAMARKLAGQWGCACALKGGHWGDADVVDVLWDQNVHYSRGPRLRVEARGTGCRYASKFAAELATGASLAGAFASAGEYVRGYLLAQR